MATYKHLRSSTANKRPTTSIADGQIAINTNTSSPGLFFKDSAGTGIVKVGPVHVGTTAPNVAPAVGGSSGNYTGEQWLDTSVSPNQMKVWNGSAWVGIVADELPVSKLQDGTAGQIIQTDTAGTGVEWSSTTNLPIASAAAPAYSFQGDPNTGIYSPGADQLAISTAGTGRVFVDANGNVGVGAIAANIAGTTRLDVGVAGSSNGMLTLRSAGGAQEANISASAAGLAFTTNSYATPFDARASEVIFGSGTSGLERLRIASDGKVGIGTSSPLALLHVSGEDANGLIARFTSGTNYQGFRFSGTTDAGNGSLVIEPDTIPGSGTAEFYTYFKKVVGGGTTNHNVIIDGKVGIGTTSPGQALSVAGNIFTSGVGANYVASSSSGVTTSYLITDASGSNIQVDGAWPIRFTTNSSERARIDSSGRLLVGTSTAPTGARSQYSKFSVYLNTQSTSEGSQLNLVGGARGLLSVGDKLGQLIFTDTTDGEYGKIACELDATPGANDYPGRLVFSTTADGAASPTERLRIDNIGRIGINTSPASFARLHIASDSDSYYPLVVDDTKTGTASATAVYFRRNTTLVGTISTTNTATAYNTSSDYRLKENVIPVTDGITRLQQLKPSRFNFIADPAKTVDGFIAHEVQTVVPEAITGEKDAVDDDGNPIYQGIDQSKLVPLLTAALQEAMERIETLEAKVAALESA